MKGEVEVFRVRDYAGSWMHLGYVPEKPAPSTREERAHPLGPGNVFVLHFEGLLDPKALLDLSQRLTEYASDIVDEMASEKDGLDRLAETGPSREHAAAEKAGQLTLLEVSDGQEEAPL